MLCSDSYEIRRGGVHGLIHLTKLADKQHTAFGNVVVASEGEGVHCWSFKILQTTKGSIYKLIRIGIVDASDFTMNNDCFLVKDSYNYCASNIQKMSRGKVHTEEYGLFRNKRVEGRTVEMTLDLKSKRLKYFVDGGYVLRTRSFGIG